MKKHKLSVLLAACLFALVLPVGCATDTTQANNTQTGNFNSDEIPEGELKKYVVNGFDSGKEMMTCSVEGTIRCYLEKGEQYVKEGEGSCKVLLKEGDKYIPKLYQPFDLSTVAGGADYSEFSVVDKISCWVYNAQDVSTSLPLDFVFNDGTKIIKTYVLQPNSWNLLVYDNYRELMPSAICDGVYFTFSHVGTGDCAYYVDGLSAYKTSSTYAPITQNRKENEICSFDEIYQAKYIFPRTFYTKAEVVADFESSSFTKTGEGNSLYVHCPAGTVNWETQAPDEQSWPGIEFYSGMVSQVEWMNYDDNDCICFDAYSPEENGLDFLWLNILDGTWKYRYSSPAFELKKGQWATYRVKVGDVKARLGYVGYSSISSISLLWGEFVGADREVWIDNVRMEVNA